MGQIDKTNMLLSSVDVLFLTIGTYKKLFFYFFHPSLPNTYSIYNTCNRKKCRLVYLVLINKKYIHKILRRKYNRPPYQPIKFTGTFKRETLSF